MESGIINRQMRYCEINQSLGKYVCKYIFWGDTPNKGSTDRELNRKSKRFFFFFSYNLPILVDETHSPDIYFLMLRLYP